MWNTPLKCMRILRKCSESSVSDPDIKLSEQGCIIRNEIPLHSRVTFFKIFLKFQIFSKIANQHFFEIKEILELLMILKRPLSEQISETYYNDANLLGIRLVEAKKLSFLMHFCIRAAKLMKITDSVILQCIFVSERVQWLTARGLCPLFCNLDTSGCVPSRFESIR